MESSKNEQKQRGLEHAATLEGFWVVLGAWRASQRISEDAGRCQTPAMGGVGDNLPPLDSGCGKAMKTVL